MERIIESKLNEYKEMTAGNKKWIQQELFKTGIKILPGFIDNRELVRSFYKLYYNKTTPRVVLCGINPGRFGAGKTGVPFLDFASLKKLLPDKILSEDSERSAQFIYQVIAHVGASTFFDNVYLTNISWFGFSKNNVNLNYYLLEPRLKNEVLSGFKEEMAIVKPIRIIPLSEQVEADLRELGFDYLLEERLRHPNYCSFPSRIDEALKRYIKVLGRLT